jgi:hypothetical protein
MTWELRLVENMGEVIGSPNSSDVAVPTEPLIEDMKKQLNFLPKNFTWTIGWRTYVWQETESKEFKDLTAEEFETLYNGGTLNNPGDDTEGDNGNGLADSSEGSTTQ